MLRKLKYFEPELIGVIIGLIMLFIWYFSSLIFEEKIVPKSFEYLIESLTVLCAAFFGSYSAFSLNNYRESKRTESENIVSIKSAIFTMARQLNTLGKVKQEIKRYESSAVRYFHVPSMLSDIYSQLKVEIQKLEFLLSLHDKDLLFEIAVEQERFDSALLAIKLKTDYHYNVIQPTLKSVNFNHPNPKFEDFEKALGFSITAIAVANSENVYEHVYKSFDSINDMQKRLAKAAKELYPKEKLIYVEVNL